MNSAIVHRGPDSSGVWTDDASRVAFAFRRLAIIDLSPEGRQPMVSKNTNWVMVFNGEFYNYMEVRKQLEAEGIGGWRGTSDTEVFLEAVAHWGLEKTLERSNGMFAVALWNRQQRQLTLVRDRAGQKPLYFAWLKNGGMIFGSELKSFWQHPDFEKEIDRRSLSQYMRYAYVPGQNCIYKNAYKLPAGSTITFDRSFAERIPPAAEVSARISKFWSIDKIASQGQQNLFAGNTTEAIEQLETRLGNAIQRRMIADVPLGAFLSGGIDSSVIVALMQNHSAQKVKTFTIGYDDPQYNEAAHALAVAKHLGTDHTELILSPNDALAVIPNLPQMFDEPFADSSQIPTFLVSQLAKQSVTVALSGDGGDEIFGGYNRHMQAPALWNKFRRVPVWLRSSLARGLNVFSPRTWDQIYGCIPGTKRHALFGDKLQKISNLLPSADETELYRSLCSQWQNPNDVMIDGADYGEVSSAPQSLSAERSFAQWLKLRDFQTYLADDILVKVDRASMSVSLEARAPLLDHELVEWAWTLPLEMNIRDGVGKWILREVLYKYVPREMIDRPKMGFGIPIVHWLRHELRDWAEDLLDETRIREEGFFDPAKIRKLWQRHLSGSRNVQHQLWTVLMFQAWYRHQSQNAAALIHPEISGSPS